jgi:polyferredoxin
LGAGALAVPRMIERRKDVVPLARHFLARCASGSGKALSRSAEHRLVSLRYSHRNAVELREAVEMAALIADEPSIQAEHIFTGPKDEGTVNEIDLTPLAFVRRVISPRSVAAGRVAVFASFAAIVALTLFAGDTPPGRFANGLTWGLWEPALFVAFFLLGRLWCTVCPISAAGRLAARLKNFDVPPGSRIKDHSGWLIVAGFLLVVWSEHAFRMTERPRAAGFLLLALFAAAILFGVVFRRETWCRYVCPLGNLGAIYSLGAVLNVRANPNVCATSCSTHECYKGSRNQPGCPVFHHPLYASDAHACKLCFQCLRVCPHGSARLSLRLPLQSVWAQADVGGALVPFALFLFFFAPAMLASQGSSWTASVPGFTATALLALLVTVVFSRRLPLLLSTTADPEPTLATRTAFSLLVLAWGPAMAYQLQHVAVLDALRLHAEAGSVAVRLLPEGELSLLPFAQLGVTLLAAVASAICLAGVRFRLRREGTSYSRRGWNLLMALCVCYFLVTLALIIPRGLHY